MKKRPIPVEQSILWKPLHDPHYVIASLQPADGGRHKIFVRQQVLGRVEAHVRGHGRRAFGLLLGQFYRCSETGADYLVIESVLHLTPVSDEVDIAPAVAEALADRLGEAQGTPLGWYRGVPAVEAKPSGITSSVHASLLPQPWQTTLVVGEPINGSSGAFFLRDTVNSRWFYAPFYELPDHAPTSQAPKSTVVNWPQYLTADNVEFVAHDYSPAAELADVRPRTPVERLAAIRGRSPFERPEPGRSTAPDSQMDIEPPAGPADVPLVVPPSQPDTPGSATPPMSASVPPADRPATRATHKGVADLPRPNRERPLRRGSDRSGEKLSIVDDRDQRAGVSSSGRRVGDADDTTLGDDPARYIELARSEGFFIAAKFDTIGESSRTETLWIMNEPYSGMLLAVVTTDSEVVDATLHYNLQTDDAGLQRTPFPEHRDPESKTVYVRESCADSLRDRCRRLRATNTLLREWKVTPAIAFLTPAEWESVPVSFGGANRAGDAISDLNTARIRELPEGVRSQFHLGDAVANP